ncbi:MAG: hypothetical protein EAX89_10635 [Candidatus Lokiarchaeota archaeon]|nr:hypothetical protein [Candidatus Lokiarchaeota archaeon]
MIEINRNNLGDYLDNFAHKVEQTSAIVLDFIQKKFKYLLFISFMFSISFGLIKTIFFTGYNVDSYQIFALSIEKLIRTGVRDELITNYYQKNRIIYPSIIAIVHIIFPINIGLLACSINLLFALANLVLMKKLLEIYNFPKEGINFFILFTVFSYNFLNYWFNIITDMAGLFFFLLMIVFLEIFQKNRQKTKYLFLVLSLISFILAFLTREVYILAFILFFVLIRPRKLRISIFFIFVFFLYLLLYIDPLIFPVLAQLVSTAYREEFMNREFIKILLLLQQKWLNPRFIQNFFKGLIKTGILPATSIFMLSLGSLAFKSFRRFVKPPNGLKYEDFNIIVVWGFIFFLAYTLYYSYATSASGLRYWLPISWIPLVYASKTINSKINLKTLKLVCILFLCIFPLSWASIELYINRNVSIGTGPLLYQDYYQNDFNDLISIENYSPTFIEINIVNRSFFQTIVTPAALENNEMAHIKSHFDFSVWINASEYIIVQARLTSPNSAYWGFSLYEIHPTLAPWIGEKKYEINYCNTTSDFELYTIKIKQAFLVRRISFFIGGKAGSTIIWDYIKIYKSK